VRNWDVPHKKCGKTHNLNKCPAYGKYYAKCKKKNHFAALCRSSGKKKLNEITEGSVDTLTSHDKEGYLFIGEIENKNNKEQTWFTEVEINNNKVKFKVDTGAMCNILSVIQLKAMGLSKIKIEPTTVMLKSYTGDKLQVKGMCKLNVKKKGKIFKLDF